MADTENPTTDQRPAPSDVSTGAQLLRWYWLKTELIAIARRLGISVRGSKQELTNAVAAALDGRTPTRKPPTRRPATARQLDGALTTETVIPAGQRCSQTLRAFFLDQIGPSFTFNAAMRSFIANRAGATLGDAVAHWHASRTAQPHDIGDQFELNRFTRQWYADHPGGTRDELQKAWSVYRTTPTDQRRRA